MFVQFHTAITVSERDRQDRQRQTRQTETDRVREGKVDILEICDGIIDQHGHRNDCLSIITNIIHYQARGGGGRERRRE
jgi:hypothetical protein